MSVLKYKDARGNWVEAKELFVANAPGELKVDFLTGVGGGQSLDLSKYKDCDDFILIYETYDDLCMFSPSFNADGSKWVFEERIHYSGFLTAGEQAEKLIPSLCQPVQHPSSLQGTNYNLTKYENNIFYVLPYNDYFMSAFVIYTE
jgi:hypothetical protein